MALADRDPDGVPPELEERVLADYGWVRALAARLLGSTNDADDVTQEVIAAALARQPRVEMADGIRRWLDRVTRTQVARWRTRARRRREIERQVEAEGHGERCPTPQPSDVVDRLHTHRALTDAVLGLPEPYRSVVVARYLDGVSCAQLAARLDVREATVRQQLARAIDMLRRQLRRDRGRDYSAGLGLLAFGGEWAAPTQFVPRPPTSGPSALTLAASAAASDHSSVACPFLSTKIV